MPVADDNDNDDQLLQADQISCQYYTSESINNFFNNTLDNNVSIFHANIRSLAKNYDELSITLDGFSKRPDILVFSETWFNEDTCEDIPGYIGRHVYREGRRGGGVSLYVNSGITFHTMSDKCFISEMMEIVTVRVLVNPGCPVTIVAIYRPPSRENIPLFIAALSDILGSFHRSTPVYVVGDINIDILEQQGLPRDFVDAMHSLSFVPLITIPTRVTAHSATLLDHVWTNQLQEANSGVLKLSTTDHYPVIVSTYFYSNTDHSANCKKVFRDHSDTAVNNLIQDCRAFMRYIDQFANMDLETRINIFHGRLYSLYDRCCKLRVKQISKKSFMRPWLTSSIKRLVNHKHFLFRRYKRGLIDFDTYNNHKNLCTRSLKKCKTDYFNRKFESCKGDLKKTWKNLKYLMNTNRKCRSITMLKYKGNDLLHSDSIAAAFNEYFSTVAIELDNQIPPIHNISPLDYLQNPTVNSFYVAPATAFEVESIIKAFPAKGGYAKWIPCYIYKSISGIISAHISELFNASIVSGYFPSCLKNARVIPIFKSGCSNKVNNYRPISTLPILAKIFEKLMYIRLMQFLKMNNILCKTQFGFQQNSSTGDAMLEFLDYIYNSLNDGKYIMPIYLDFSKAFDTVNHDILLSKLNHYGIRGVANNWFKSYLLDRVQYVSIGGSVSDKSTINMGVPQGSILGPCLFLLYINDMSQSSNLNFIHFADETTMVATEDSERDLFATVNRELKSVDKWLRVNRLSLNLKKTKYMIITNKAMLHRWKVRIRRRAIKRVDYIKFLGVMLDDKLNFDRHALYISGKVARAVGVINRVTYHLPFSQLVNLYRSIIYPHLIYCISIWGRPGSVGVGRIQRVQKRAIGVISRYEANHQVVTDTLMNVDSIYKYLTSIKLFKVFKEGQHTYFLDRICNV